MQKINIDPVQPTVDTTTGISGWCFVIRDHAQRPRFTLHYASEEDAEAARVRMMAASIDALVGLKWLDSVAWEWRSFEPSGFGARKEAAERWWMPMRAVKKQIEILRASIRLGWVDIASRPMTASERRELRRQIYELMEELARLLTMLEKLPD
jgi:hypothetical protein